MIIIRAVQMRIVFILVAGGLALAGCGSEEGSDSRTVVATTGILANIAGNVAGPALEVEQLIPDGSSPHDYALSADDRLVLEQADLVVADGAGLEATLPLDEVDAPRWELSAHAGPLLADDPHVWMDPSRVAAALPSLADALAEVDPAHAADFRGRAEDYARELNALDAQIERELSRIPVADRELVTSHDALGYFADRYGLAVVATAFPTSGPEAEASAAAVSEVIDAVRANQVPAVFAGEEDDPEALRLVADETGALVVDDLIVESLGSAESYEDMLRHDAGSIASALGDG